MRKGTIVDATIIAAPPSTKNKQKGRDPEMHQTKKGNQWHFGMKAHIGVDAASGVVHSLKGTAANEADINQMAALLHGQEQAVFADAGYTGAAKRPEHAGREVSWNIAVKRGIIKALPKALRDLAEPAQRGPWRRCEPGSSIPSTSSRTSSAIRSCATAGWPRTPRKLYTLFALANLTIVKKTLLTPAQA
jgi:IS5 family transposase